MNEENEEKKRPQDITSLERSQRVNEVHTLILQGATTHQIIEYCRKQFNVEKSTVYFYIEDAKQILKENFQKTFDVEGFKAEIYARLENLYQQNMDIDDFKECRNIIKDLREMLGLNEAQKMDLTTKGKEIPSNTIQVEIVKPINSDDEE